MTILRKSILFLTMMLFALLAGRAFWVWVVDNPANFAAETYVAYFQVVDKSIAIPIAAMGTAAALLAAVSAALSFRDRHIFYLLLGACCCVVVSDVLTVLVHLPINHEIAGFNPMALPAIWPALRDRWWEFHKLRLLALLAGTSLVFLAALARMRDPSQD